MIGKPKGETPHGDVLVVAHGHILRAFAMRWVGKTLPDGPAFLLEAGGVGTLRYVSFPSTSTKQSATMRRDTNRRTPSYEHHNIDEPAILLGGAFVVS